jgi:transcriptional regulator with XRE-family HTH domain
MSIGDKVHQRRREKKLSILAVASKSGLSRNAISLIENNNSNPTVETLVSLGKALECELEINFKPWESFRDGPIT